MPGIIVKKKEGLVFGEPIGAIETPEVQVVKDKDVS